MSKILGFGFLYWLTGSPFIAILILLVILYFVDRSFIGFLPNIARPIQQSRRLSKLKQELRLSPHLTSAKLEVARILIEKKSYADAKPYLLDAKQHMTESAEVLSELGICELKLGNIEQGESYILEALQINPRVKYGEPYLRLGEAMAKIDATKALQYLESFRAVQSSSCEAYVKLGNMYEELGRADDAKSAYREAVQIYQLLPKYKKKSERKWAWIARSKS